MISKRFCKLAYSLNLVRGIGGISVSFDMNTLQFKDNISENSKLYRLLKINYVIVTFIHLLQTVIVVKYYAAGNTGQFYLAWVFWLAEIICFMFFSVTFWISDELCQIVNGFLGFLRFLHRKVISEHSFS